MRRTVGQRARRALRRAALAALACGLGAAMAGEGMASLSVLRDEMGMSFEDSGTWDIDLKKAIAYGQSYPAVSTGQFRLTARNIMVYYETSDLYAEGDVEFAESGGSTLRCDRIFLHLDLKTRNYSGLAVDVSVKIEDNTVHLPVQGYVDTIATSTDRKQMTDTLSGEAANTNFNGVRRLYARAAEARILSENHIELIDTTVTGDGYAEPHWRLQLKSGLLRRQEKFEAYHPTFRIANVPVFYFPYYIRDLQYDWPWVSVGGGRSSDWGAYVQTRVGWSMWNDPDNFIRPRKWYLDLDAMRERGLGFGGEVVYKTGPNFSYGHLRAYNVSENWISAKDDLHRAVTDNEDRIYQGDSRWSPSRYRGDNRFLVDWEHYQEWNDLWTLRGELRYYRDRDMAYEYDKSRYVHERDPAMGVSVRRISEDFIFEAVAQRRVNAWQTQSEYLPELRLGLPMYQLFDTLPLYLTQDARLGLVNRRFDEDLEKYGRLEWLNDPSDPSNPYAYGPRVKHGSDYGYYFRAAGETKLEAKIPVKGLTVKPWAAARYGYFEDTYGQPVEDALLAADDLAARRAGRFTPGQVKDADHQGFIAFPFGVEVSTRLYTLFGNRNWRLITEPVFGYTHNPGANTDPVRLYPIDDVETYAREAYFSFDLHHKLQKKDAGAIRDVLDLNVSLRYYPREGDRAPRNYGRDFTEIEVDAIWRPTAKTTLWANGLVDTQDGTLNRYGAGADWRFRDLVRVYADHLHYRGEYWKYPYQQMLDQTTFAVRSKLWNDASHYAGEFAIIYDWRDRGTESVDGVAEYRISLIRNFWDNFEATFSFFENRRKRDSDGDYDRGVHFAVAPMGFMGFERPTTPKTLASEKFLNSRYADQPDPRSYATASRAYDLYDDAEDFDPVPRYSVQDEIQPYGGAASRYRYDDRTRSF